MDFHVIEGNYLASVDLAGLAQLDDAATFGCDHEVPWFAFLALPDDASENSDAST